MIYSKLPLELIYHILLYTGIVKYRNGKYIDQIPRTDERYKLFDSIPRHRVFHIANKCILYVTLKTASNHCKLISIKFDFENQEIVNISPILRVLFVSVLPILDNQEIKYTPPLQTVHVS